MNAYYEQRTSCPHCKNVSFVPMMDGAAPLVTAQSVSTGDYAGSGLTFGSPTFELAYKICTTCGYVGTFSYQFIHKR